MKVLDLFSGIGGFSLGLEWAGFETVAFCEYDEACKKVLDKHWPDVPKYTDVRELTAEQLNNDGIRDIGIITGGFPCQPYSRAGKRKASFDDRDMAPEFVRLVEDVKPAFAIGENVQGFVDVGLVPFLDDLEKVGYYTQALSIPSCAVGLPSVERHIWTISTPNEERCKRISERAIQIITDMQGKFQGSDSRIPDRWNLPKARVCGAGEGVAGRMDRLEQIGNSIPPQVVKVIGKAINLELKPKP